MLQPELKSFLSELNWVLSVSGATFVGQFWSRQVSYKYSNKRGCLYSPLNPILLHDRQPCVVWMGNCWEVYSTQFCHSSRSHQTLQPCCIPWWMAPKNNGSNQPDARMFRIQFLWFTDEGYFLGLILYAVLHVSYSISDENRQKKTFYAYNMLFVLP